MRNELPSLEETTVRRPRPVVRLLGLLLVLFAVFSAVYLVVAYLAWENGQSLRQAEAQTQRSQQISRQLELAQQDLVNGSMNLSQRRLEWVLQQEPENAAALTLQQQLHAGLEATRIRPTATPEPTAVADEQPEEAVSAAEASPELQRLRDLAAEEQWEELLPELLSFQQRYPSYEREQTDQLLYDTYLNLGLAYVETEKVELGLNYLSQAESLGNLPQEALDYRFWANLYLQGIGYYGVNWGIAASNFRELCLSAPFYQNACGRLQEALINYGDQWAFAQEWCPAEVAYQEAFQLGRTQILGNKLAQARDGCFNATPTPPADDITGTIPFTGTFPITGTEGITETEQ